MLDGKKQKEKRGARDKGHAMRQERLLNKFFPFPFPPTDVAFNLGTLLAEQFHALLQLKGVEQALVMVLEALRT